MLILAFFLSGAAGLVYEIAWMRSLSLAFGASTPAVATVLAAFMGGLALGSGLLGRRLDRVAWPPLRLYGGLEFAIPVAAALLPLGLRAVSGLYLANYGVDGPGPGAALLRFLLVLILLVIPTALMGATFPVFVRAYAARTEPGVSERKVAALYGFNTLGAVVGAGLAGFVLVRFLGLTGAIACAAVLNLAAGGIALAAGRKIVPTPAPPRRGAAPLAATTLPSWAIFAAALLAGLSTLACEVVWSRVLHLVLAGNIFSFTTMLMAFLTGIAAGSLVVTARRGASAGAVPYLLLGLGVAMAAAIPLIFASTRIFGAIMNTLAGAEQPGWNAVLAGRYLLAAAIMFVPAALSGALFPVLAAQATRASGATASRAGLVYALNTIGGVAGSLLAGFLLIPWLGTQGTVLMCAALLVALGAAILSRSTPAARRAVALGAVALAAVAVTAAGLSHRGEKFIGKLGRGQETRVVRYEEGVGATTVVVQDVADSRLRLYTNGTFAVDTSYESQQVVAFLGHLPAIFAAGRQEALVIGMGMGSTLAAVASHDFAAITCVEIVPGVFDAAPLFAAWNHDVLSDPRVRRVVEDGRSYLAGSRRQFDVITCDPIHPAFGSPALYTREYYRLCRSHLAPGGAVAQYLPLHQLAPEDFAMLLRTFAREFPHCAVYLAISHGVLLGSDMPLAVDEARLATVFGGKPTGRLPAPGTLLRAAGVTSPAKLLSCVVLGENDVAALAGEGPINTDGHPHIEFSEGRFAGRPTADANLAALLRAQPDGAASVRGATPELTGAIAQATTGRRHFLAAALAHARGDGANAVEQMRRADLSSPDDPDILAMGGPALGQAHLAHARALLERWRRGERTPQVRAAAEQSLTRALASLPNDPQASALLHEVRDSAPTSP